VLFFSFLVPQKLAAEWRNSAPEFVSRKYNRIVFLGSDLLQFYEGYFYYKYRPCIRVNLEREVEGPENKGLETNNKLGFREISLSGRH